MNKKQVIALLQSWIHENQERAAVEKNRTLRCYRDGLVDAYTQALRTIETMPDAGHEQGEGKL